MTAKRTPEQVRAVIRKYWTTRAVADIACRVNLSAKYVRHLAAEMGLPPRPTVFIPGGAPDKPRGYSAEELAWARENVASDMEALAILVHAGEVRSLAKAASLRRAVR